MNRGERLILLCILFLMAAGCVQKPEQSGLNNATNKLHVYYPSLPNEPKYQFLYTISSSKDIEKPKGKLFDFVAGDETRKVVSFVKPYGTSLWGNRLFICDMKTGLHVMDLEEGTIETWGRGSVGILSKPVNLEIDREIGEVFVADIIKKQVMVYSSEGLFLRAYGVEGQLMAPVDVALTESKLFVCDVRAHQVVVFDRATGEELYRIAKPGSGSGDLFHPSCIEIQSNRLYVTDTTNFRVQIFSLKGKPLDRFGSVGKVIGTFSRPKGLAVDRESRIYVGDPAFDNIQVFDKEHRLLLPFLQTGYGPGMVNMISGIEISYDIPEFFRRKLAPNFEPQYLLLVASQFGANKINVYAFGSYKN